MIAVLWNRWRRFGQRRWLIALAVFMVLDITIGLLVGERLLRWEIRLIREGWSQ